MFVLCESVFSGSQDNATSRLQHYQTDYTSLTLQKHSAQLSSAMKTIRCDIVKPWKKKKRKSAGDLGCISFHVWMAPSANVPEVWIHTVSQALSSRIRDALHKIHLKLKALRLPRPHYYLKCHYLFVFGSASLTSLCEGHQRKKLDSQNI